ncbi:interferon-induced protein 44-like [Engraulis encrasicolus]|uniref:interferon-induced protein 44-like n=1 Tax=Engraulis encrasicolus TaxID=184585 RepID=UPI002FD70D15
MKMENFTLSNPDIGHLRFLLHGPVGYGKSSIINSFNSVFQRRVTEKALTAAATGTSHTKVYQTYQVKDVQGRELPFVFNDSMGLEDEEEGGALSDDIITAIQGHVKDGYKFNKGPLRTWDKHYYNKSPSLSDKVHCLVSVLRADKISLLDTDGGNLTKMRNVRHAASDLGIPQVVIMTHVDECCPLVKEDLKNIYKSKKIHQAMQQCSVKLGVPLNCIFPVKNYHQETKVDNKTDCVILEALEKITHLANDYVEDKITRVSPLKIAAFVVCMGVVLISFLGVLPFLLLIGLCMYELLCS